MADGVRSATTRVPLQGMDCRDCARIVHTTLMDLPGVVFVAIDPDRQEAHVEYDPRLLGEAQVQRLIPAVVAGRGALPGLPTEHARHERAVPASDGGGQGHARHDGETDHDHAHGIGQYRDLVARNRKRLLLVVGFGAAVMVAEVVGAVFSGSLVLLSDAAHMFTDVSAIALAYLAMRWSSRPATVTKSYGFYRAEIVAAFVNALALWVVGGYFLYEAFTRLADPPVVDGGIVSVVAFATLVANVLMARGLHRGAGESINVRSAYVHVLSDILGSVAALVTGVGILFFGWTWLDPVTTLFVSGLILVWTYRLTRQTLHILLEGTPERMDTEALRRDVLDVDGVTDVHDLHVWTITTGVDSMSAHIRVLDPSLGPEVVREVRRRVMPKYGLGHLTLEVERDDAECASCD